MARSMRISHASPSHSIAVSAVVRPSLRLSALLFLMAVALLASAAVIHSKADTALDLVLVSVCAIAGCALSLFPLLRRNSCRIDVTGIGQIRLVDTSPEADAGSTGQSTCSGEVVQLLRDSTFWSSLMVLRLQSGSGRIAVLVILPDSMDRGAFHALSVACRWVAARQFSSKAKSFDPFQQSD